MFLPNGVRICVFVVTPCLLSRYSNGSSKVCQTIPRCSQLHNLFPILTPQLHIHISISFLQAFEKLLIPFSHLRPNRNDSDQRLEGAQQHQSVCVRIIECSRNCSLICAYLFAHLFAHLLMLTVLSVQKTLH